MDSDERDIFQYLKTWGTQFIGAKEVSRRAGGRKRAQKDADWAKPILIRMAERGILESDALGRFRVKPVSRQDRHKRWVSPEITKILGEGGVQVDDAADLDSDEHYEQL
jgi:hypothetical protein